MKKNIKITGGGVKVLQAMANACAQWKFEDRNLNKIHYCSKRNMFIAGDGHIIRCEKNECWLPDSEINYDFFIDKSYILKFKNIKDLNFYDIEIETECVYGIKNAMFRLIEMEREFISINKIAFDLNLISRLNKTFIKKTINSVSFNFTGFAGACVLTRLNSYTGEYEIVGLIMPLKMNNVEKAIKKANE